MCLAFFFRYSWLPKVPFLVSVIRFSRIRVPIIPYYVLLVLKLNKLTQHVYCYNIYKKSLQYTRYVVIAKYNEAAYQYKMNDIVPYT